MGDDFATVALARRTWAVVFLGLLSHLYSIVHERDKWEEGSSPWNHYQHGLRDAINSYMPVINEAAMIDPSISKEWYDFKIIAGMFPKEVLEDNAKELVYVVPAV